MFKQNKTKRREEIIHYIYKFELMNEIVNNEDGFEKDLFNKRELDVIQCITDNYEKYKKLISKFIKDNWSWSRLKPLERAVLLYGCFELMISDKALVINELVYITKKYIPEETAFRFINAILQNIGDYYEKIKGN